MLKRACLSALVGLVALSTFAASGPGPRQLITSRIDENSVVTRGGNIRPEMNATNDRGQLANSYAIPHMQLLLQRSPEQEEALQTLIGELHDPHSANYHKWLTAAQFGSQYGLAQSDLNTIVSWLQSHGFTVNSIAPNHMVIDFSGTAGQVHQAFHAEMHQLSVDGVNHIANAQNPTIPAALAPAVVGVASLNDFRPKQMKVAKPAYTFGPSCGFLTGLRDSSTNCEALMPQDLATIYNLTPLFNAGITGRGRTVVVVEDEDPYSLSDWNTFRKVSGLARTYPYGTIAVTHPPSSGVNNCSDPGDLNDTTDDEVAIDMEWASAAAPNAAIQVAVCDDTRTTFGGLIAVQNILNSGTLPDTISMSYGESESRNGATQNAMFNTTFQQAATEGVSVFVSSGDEGPASTDANRADATHGITVSGFTSTPYNISVGGTDFGDSYLGQESHYWNAGNSASYGSAKSYMPEIPWNDSCADNLIINFLHTYYDSGLINGYGPSGIGVCNTWPVGGTAGSSAGDFLTTGSGSGGPSNCATGAPTTSGTPASGGTCAGYTKPSWQAVYGNPSDGVRDIPDVSLMAANGVWNHFYPICLSNPAEVSEGYAAPCTGPPDTWPGFGGTSVSSPIWAGIQALVNQHTNQKWGNANTVYYAIANAEYGTSGNSGCNSSLGSGIGASCVFNDVTAGSIYLPCATTGNGSAARLYNCYRPAATEVSGDYGVMSAAPMTFPGLGGPGPVTNLNVTNPGGGTTAYSSAPTCALTGGAGSGATCTTTISGVVSSLTVTQGTGYTAAGAPACALTGGGGFGATCNATVNGAGNITLTLVNPGQGYTSAPSCVLIGGSGTGASCSASETTGVTGISITASGSGYTADPTCTLSGGGGSPAATCASVINGVTSQTPQAYPATVGWDFATGIGTVNGYNLVFSPFWVAPE